MTLSLKICEDLLQFFMASAFIRQRFWMALGFFFFEIFILSACTTHNQTPQINPTHASIRKDGTLDFVHPDSTIAASIDIEIADTPETQMTVSYTHLTLPTNREV